MESLVEGEPTRLASITSTSDTWRMLFRGTQYTVHVSPYDSADNSFVVAIDIGKKELFPNATPRTWTVMKGRLTGGVVTPEFVSESFHQYGMDIEPLSILIASALGRPYALYYAPEENDTSHGA